MKLSDFLKKTELKLVKKRKESGDKHVFHFESKGLVNWKAGQYGMFIFKGTRLKGNNHRIFSIASSANEKDIIIATNIVKNPSEFKAKLKSMNIGESIFFRGPLGSLIVPNFDKKIALISGGIGVTPMRSILKDLEDEEIPTEITLFYIDSKKDFVFRSELESILLKNPKININFLDNRNTFKEFLSEYLEENKNNSLYFISGKPKMVKSIRKDIKNRGIKRKNIKSDKFSGYK